VLKRARIEFKDAVQIGRTHGVHAEPITFGLKLAIWYEEAGRDLQKRWKPRRKICAWARSRARWARSRISGRRWKKKSARSWV
jgi:adenylosuccinate lyase